jgi:hypothetical protein
VIAPDDHRILAGAMELTHRDEITAGDIVPSPREAAVVGALEAGDVYASTGASWMRSATARTVWPSTS